MCVLQTKWKMDNNEGGKHRSYTSKEMCLQKKYHKMDKDWKNTKTQILYEQGDESKADEERHMIEMSSILEKFSR